MKSVKIVYNSCYGGFGISKKAVLLARELSGNPRWGECCLLGEKFYSDGQEHDFIVDFDYNSYEPTVPRHDEILVRVVEELGEESYGDCAELRIMTVEQYTPYRIAEYDGMETVMTLNTDNWQIAT